MLREGHMSRRRVLTSISMLSIVSLASAGAQVPNGSRSVAGTQASANIHLVAHIPLRATDIDIEQELRSEERRVGKECRL